MNLFDISKLENELKKLEIETSKPEFWENTENTTKVLSKMKIIKNKYTKYKELEKEITNLLELSELVNQEYDQDIANDIIKNTKKDVRRIYFVFPTDIDF